MKIQPGRRIRSSALVILSLCLSPFARGQVTVQHRDECLQRTRTETGLESFDRLRRERNLRHEDDGAFALLKAVSD